MSCLNCHWWNEQYGCQNTNWVTDTLTDPSTPVCGGLSFKIILIKDAS